MVSDFWAFYSPLAIINYAPTTTQLNEATVAVFEIESVEITQIDNYVNSCLSTLVMRAISGLISRVTACFSVFSEFCSFMFQNT